MNFDVILHGKPNAGSHKATKGLEESFCQNLVENFFQSMNHIKEQEVLIVDVRNWKNKWYSIYTFWLGGNVIDTASRSSFIALSIVVPNQYFCLVSDIYRLLEKAFLKDIIGTYLSEKKKYIIQSFDNDSSFDRLVNTINSNFVNLGENFSDSFRQTSNDSFCNCYYSLLDCDSKAFVEDWKKYGRIFVSKTCESKDTRLSNVDKFYNELQNVQRELQLKLQEIKQLTIRIKELEGLLSSGNSETNKVLASLKEQVKILDGEKKVLEKSLSELTSENKKHRDLERQIANVLGVISVSKSSNPNKEKEDVPVPKIGLKRMIPIINMFLLIFILLVVSFRSCGTQTTDSIHRKVENLNKIIEEKDKEIRNLKEKSGGNIEGEDVNCNLTVFQDNIPVYDVSKIDPNKKIAISVTEQNGYAFYTSNLK